ncbi:MAG: hypothetical protein GY841_02800 [FCB group bacterium]|nr:hypothetical protein [FCB group bacterium]
MIEPEYRATFDPYRSDHETESTQVQKKDKAEIFGPEAGRVILFALNFGKYGIMAAIGAAAAWAWFTFNNAAGG